MSSAIGMINVYIPLADWCRFELALEMSNCISAIRNHTLFFKNGFTIKGKKIFPMSAKYDMYSQILTLIFK